MTTFAPTALSSCSPLNVCAIVTTSTFGKDCPPGIEALCYGYSATGSHSAPSINVFGELTLTGAPGDTCLADFNCGTSTEDLATYIGKACHWATATTTVPTGVSWADVESVHC